MKNAKIRKTIQVVTLALLAVLLQGCATNLRQPASVPQPVTQKLSTFRTVQMKPVTISSAFADSEANQKAARKINENLFAEMKMVIPNLQEAKGIPSAGTLVITPVIEEIKFIGGFARFMVGAMAGSSAVLMKVTYADADTGKVVGAPEFYRAASAMAGGYSVGSSDNMMLTEIARDIANYTRLNL